MIPTIACFIIAIFLWQLFDGADKLHWISGDFALFSLILLFRALKEWVSWRQKKAQESERGRHRFHLGLSFGASVVCALGVIADAAATICNWPLPLPERVVKEIVGPTYEMSPRIGRVR